MAFFVRNFKKAKEKIYSDKFSRLIEMSYASIDNIWNNTSY